MQADLALLCNINFSRPLLQRAKQLGNPSPVMYMC